MDIANVHTHTHSQLSWDVTRFAFFSFWDSKYYQVYVLEVGRVG